MSSFDRISVKCVYIADQTTNFQLISLLLIVYNVFMNTDKRKQLHILASAYWLIGSNCLMIYFEEFCHFVLFITVLFFIYLFIRCYRDRQKKDTINDRFTCVYQPVLSVQDAYAPVLFNVNNNCK